MLIRLGLHRCTALSVALLIIIKGDFMKIEEAIIHALDTSKNMDECKSCRDEHKQLAKWLQELKQIKDILGNDYDLDRLREIIEADRDGRCVILPTFCDGCEHHSEVDGYHWCKFWYKYCPDDSEFYCKAGQKGKQNG